MRSRLCAAVALCAALFVVGCSKKASAPPAPAVAANTPAPDASAGGEGAAVFAQHCQKCHGGGKAPDLSRIGAEHDAAWIAEHTKNPKAHKPMSKMPAFEGKLTDTEVKAVADMLAAKKG